MAERDPKTGRFVRADAKPVLHRQVDDQAPEWLQREPAARPDPHGRRIDVWLVILIALAVLALAIGGIWFGALDGGLV